MKKLLVFGVFVIFLTLAITPSINANTITIRNNGNNQETMTTNAIDFPVNVPPWNVGNSWTYDMTLAFEALDDNQGTTLKVNGRVPSMYCRVDEIKCINGEEVYILDIDGLFSGTVNLLGILDIGHLNNVAFGGSAYFNANRLAPQSFFFELDGKMGTPLGDVDFYFTLDMSFEPSFDFINFPIYEDEESWDISTDASLTAYVKIKLLGLINYETTYGPQDMDFDDTISNMGVETVNVGAGSFETVKLGGIYGDPSEIYYAPEVGFLAKVYEKLLWGEGGNIVALFDLELSDTNYIVGNDPPNKPSTPSGSSTGYLAETYSYTTKATDPEGDKVYYWFDWGDGFNSGWLGPYSSGSERSAEHAWVQKGIYNVVVRAKDESGIISEWSDPFTVTIGYEQPAITFIMHRIWQKDGIDVWYPWDPDNLLPELYYDVVAESDDFTATDSYHNTDDGEYSNDGNKWNSNDDWTMDKEHELVVESREVLIKIKVMDWDGDSGDDLADVSGCNYPDNDGVNDGTPNKRGALFHSTYDMGSTETYPLSPYSDDHNDYSDYWAVQDDYYVCKGDDPPDSSTWEEAWLSAENDAKVWFAIYDNYDLPGVTANIVNLPMNLRPGNSVDFMGIVKEGATPFTWYWKFGDGQTSNEQNPSHSYSSSGKYTVTLKLTDRLGQTSTDSFELRVYNNQRPEDLKITGPSSGAYGTEYSYRFQAVDPEQDILSYKISWGDGDDTGWINELNSGDVITKSHTWDSERSYTITFTARDEYGAERSKTTTVSMPRARFVTNPILAKFLDRYPLLRHLLLTL